MNVNVCYFAPSVEYLSRACEMYFLLKYVSHISHIHIRVSSFPSFENIAC